MCVARITDLGWTKVCLTIAVGCTLSPMGLILSTFADESPKVAGHAPPGHSIVKYTRGGAYFVAKELKEEYDRLLGHARSIQVELRAERITGEEATRELNELQAKLRDLRKQIEDKKVLVKAATVHTQSETTTFELGAERMLVITADNIRVEGWDGPQVKCVLEKTILAPEGVNVDDHLKGLRVVHKHGLAPNTVGRTQADHDADEQKFLASPDGQKLTDKQKESRHKLVQSIAEGTAAYREFKGREIDTLEIEGLTHEQGNRQIQIKLDSPGAGASHGSGWQRHASLTVYVPNCNFVALRGCLVGLDVSGLHAGLVVTRDGSLDRDYEGAFQIRELHGSLVVDNAPLDLVENIQGNVRWISTVELANTGTAHDGDQRTAYTPPPREVICRNVDGDLTAWFSRADLKVESVSGSIDVKNEFGDTLVKCETLAAEKSHRVVSDVGRVEVQFSKDALGAVPFSALTSCGTVRTNYDQRTLQETSFTIGRDYTGASRSWRGMKSSPSRNDAGFDASSFMHGIDRLADVLQGLERSPGFDVISRAGTVVVRRK